MSPRKLFCLLLLSTPLCSYCMESDSSEDDLLSMRRVAADFSSTAAIPTTNLLLEKGKTQWSDGSLNIFPFASGQGNFILLKCRDRIMVLDGGTQSLGFSGREAFDEGKSPSSWNEFLAKNNDILNEIFSGAKISAVLVTHPDSDHYDWLGGLFAFAFEKNKNEKLNGVSFFLGGKGKDFEYCKKIAEKQCKDCFFYIREISPDSSFKKTFGTQSTTLYRKGLEYVEDTWVRWVLHRIEDPNCNDGYDNDEIESLLNNCTHAGVSILSPIPTARIAQDNNSNSLVVCIDFGVGTVLFTGDATGNTLDAIYGDTKNPDPKIIAVSLRNRRLLRRVNFLIAPHHGAETDGSPFWLSQIIKLSSNSFVGTVFCAPHASQFQHPNRYIDAIPFPASAKSWLHEVGYYREDKKRRKTTDNSIFITSFAKYGTYWLNLSGNGMFMFSDESGKLEQLVSEKGWSMYTDRLLKLGNEDNFDAFLPIALHNPHELSVRNARGETPFIQLLRSKPVNEEFIKNMLIVALLIADNEIYEYPRSLLGVKLANNRMLQSLHNKFQIKGMTFVKSLSFLFRGDELRAEDLGVLESLNDPLTESIFSLSAPGIDEDEKEKKKESFAHFSAASASASAPIQRPISVQGYDIRLRRVLVSGDGDCGYTAMGISRATAAADLMEAINGINPAIRDRVIQLISPEIEDHFGDLPLTADAQYQLLKKQIEDSERNVMMAVDLARTALIQLGHKVQKLTIEELVNYMNSGEIQGDALLQSLQRGIIGATQAKEAQDALKKAFCKTKEAAIAYVNHFIKVTAAELTATKRPVNDNYLNVSRENGRTSEADALAYLRNKNLCVVNRLGNVLHFYDIGAAETIYLIKEEWYDHYDKGELVP